MRLLTQDKKAIVTLGNHDQMTRDINGKWANGDNSTLKRLLRNLDNIILLDNSTYCDGNIVFGNVNLDFDYYEKFHESKDKFKEEFALNSNGRRFCESKYGILLVHEPQSIIRVSKEQKKCIQDNVELVLPGHMHNGFMPNSIANAFNVKNRGFISPSREIFPKYTRGKVDVCDTSFIINGPVNTRVESDKLNEFYGTNATFVKIHSK